MKTELARLTGAELGSPDSYLNAWSAAGWFSEIGNYPKSGQS